VYNIVILTFIINVPLEYRGYKNTEVIKKKDMLNRKCYLMWEKEKKNYPKTAFQNLVRIIQICLYFIKKPSEFNCPKSRWDI